MKVVLDVKFNKELDTNDVLIYQNKCWQNVSKNAFLSDLNNEVKILKNKCDEFERLINELNEKVKELRGED